MGHTCPVIVIGVPATAVAGAVRVRCSSRNQVERRPSSTCTWSPVRVEVPLDDVTPIESTRCEAGSTFIVSEPTTPDRPSALARPADV